MLFLLINFMILINVQNREHIKMIVFYLMSRKIQMCKFSMNLLSNYSGVT